MTHGATRTGWTGCGLRIPLGVFLRWLPLWAICSSPAGAVDQTFVPLENSLWAERLGLAIDQAIAGKFNQGIEIFQSALADGEARLMSVDDSEPADLAGLRASIRLGTVRADEFEFSNRRFVPVRHFAARALALLPPQGRRVYREVYDALWEPALEAHARDGDWRRLMAYCERYPLSRHAYSAGLTIGDGAFEAGNFEMAARWWRRLLVEQPADEVDIAVVKKRLAEVAGAESSPGATVDGWRLTTLHAKAIKKSWESDLWSRLGVEPERRVPLNFRVQRAFSIYSNFADNFPFRPLMRGSDCFLSGVYSLYRFDNRPDSGSILVEYGKPTPRSLRQPYYTERSTSAVYDVTLWEAKKASAALRRALPARFPTEVALAGYLTDRVESSSFMNYDITVEIPIRSLVAFDADKRSVLWKTGKKRPQTYRRRLPRSRVTISPKKELSYTSPIHVRDGLVIAAGWIQRGYVDTLVRAHDLRDGTKVWETFLCGSQGELTMFGEMAREPFAASTLLDGDTLYVCSNSGAIAALDVHTGHVRWLTTYDSIPFVATLGQKAQLRETYWGSNPLMLLGNVLIATPRDSEYLVAIDLGQGKAERNAASERSASEPGRVLWKYHNQNGMMRDLLGFREGHLHFSGPMGLSVLDVRGFPGVPATAPVDAGVADPLTEGAAGDSEIDDAADRRGGASDVEPIATLLFSPAASESRELGPGVLLQNGVLFSDARAIRLYRFPDGRLLGGELDTLVQEPRGPGRLMVENGLIYLTTRHLLAAFEAETLP